MIIMRKIRLVEKTIILNRKKVRVLEPSRVISKEEFEKIAKPIFKEAARNLKTRHNRRK